MAKVMLTKKQQQQKRLEKQQEESKLARLRKELGRDPKSGRPELSVKAEKDLGAPTVSVLEQGRDTKHHKSMLTERASMWDNVEVFEFEIENYEEREKAARIETERKKKRLAPLYNKGPVQYITDDADPTTIGRKL